MAAVGDNTSRVVVLFCSWTMPGLIENVVSFVEGGKSIGMFLRETLATHSQFVDVVNVRVQ